MKVFTVRRFATTDSKGIQLDNLKELLKIAEENLSRVQQRQDKQLQNLKDRNSREIESYKNRVEGIKRSINELSNN